MVIRSKFQEWNDELAGKKDPLPWGWILLAMVLIAAASGWAFYATQK